MAWELPSKPVYLDEELRESYEMGELPLLHRNDKNVSNVQYTASKGSGSKGSNGYKQNSIESNYYYTNIPKQKIAYDKYDYQQQQQKPIYYTHYGQPVYAGNTNNQIDATNKIQYYVSYADKLMKQFKQVSDQIPKNRPLNSNDFQQFTNMYEQKSLFLVIKNLDTFFSFISVSLIMSRKRKRNRKNRFLRKITDILFILHSKSVA